MRSTFVATAMLLCAGLVSAQDAKTAGVTPEEAKEGFVSLFDGKTLGGWQGAVKGYAIEDGAMVCKPGGNVYTTKEYANFILRFEFKLPPAGNNGLAIRYPGKGDTAYVGMCELQILDDSSPKYAALDPRQYTGSIYGVVPAHRGYLRPVGEWNIEHVTVRGSVITVELNGTVIVNGDVSKATEFMGNKEHPGLTRTRGFFGFAGHNEPVQYRNVSIKKLN